MISSEIDLLEANQSDFTDLDSFEGSCAEMLLKKPASNKKINLAGKIIVSDSVSSEERAQAQELVNAWRASYALPLRFVYRELRKWSMAGGSNVLTSRRLKRMESITAKLRRPENRNMQITTMQDVGGCRVIFPKLENIADVLRMENINKWSNFKHVADRSDYLEYPKPDGYRGFHVVVRPHFRNPKYVDWNSHKIEIQIRTAAQHAWSTALETVDLFSGQNLKTGGGSSEWRRFFALASSAIGKREGLPITPGTPEDDKDLADELMGLSLEIDAYTKMKGWRAAIDYSADLFAKHSLSSDEKHVVLVNVDIASHKVNITSFHNEELDDAISAYAEAESEIRNGRKAHAVLVGLENMLDLKNAYPNLYANTQDFWEVVGAFLFKHHPETAEKMILGS